MDILTNPNVAYLFLVAGFWLGMLAIAAPGTGLLEIGSVVALLLAGWGIYNLPINFWALGLLVLGVFPFLLALRKSGRLIYLGISILALVIGSAFLFRGEGRLPAVNPVLAIVVSTLTVIFFWVATRKVLEAENAPPTHNLEALIGASGEAKTNILNEGSVLVAGELWSAQSEQPIAEGLPVRVVGRDGFILKVVPAQSEKPQVSTSPQ